MLAILQFAKLRIWGCWLRCISVDIVHWTIIPSDFSASCVACTIILSSLSSSLNCFNILARSKPFAFSFSITFGYGGVGGAPRACVGFFLVLIWEGLVQEVGQWHREVPWLIDNLRCWACWYQLHWIESTLDSCPSSSSFRHLQLFDR